jgi:hypothetical protein
MAKISYVAFLTMLSAGLVGASIITTSPCAVLEVPNAGPLESSVCSVTADPGFFINSVTVTITSDYTGYQTGSPVVTYLYTFAVNTAGFGAIPNGMVTSNGEDHIPNENFNSTVTGNFDSTVTERINLTNSVTGGVVTGTSGVMTISATEIAQIITAPEPLTLSLIGAGLLSLGLLRRRGRRA